MVIGFRGLPKKFRLYSVALSIGAGSMFMVGFYFLIVCLILAIGNLQIYKPKDSVFLPETNLSCPRPPQEKLSCPRPTQGKERKGYQDRGRFF